MALCPAHDDRLASLHVSLGTNGRVLLKCYAGCETNDVREAAGIPWPDLFPSEEKGGGLPRETVYVYERGGKAVCRVVRTRHRDGGKRFYQQRPGPDGTWVNNVQGVEPPLYRVDALL